MIWDGNKQQFIELDESREFPIDDEDGDAGAGLVTALLFGGLFWGCVALWILEPWTRRPLGVSLGLVVFAGVVLGLHTYLVEPWRRRHADSRLVDWLRKGGPLMAAREIGVQSSLDNAGMRGIVGQNVVVIKVVEWPTRRSRFPWRRRFSGFVQVGDRETCRVTDEPYDRLNRDLSVAMTLALAMRPPRVAPDLQLHILDAEPTP